VTRTLLHGFAPISRADDCTRGDRRPRRGSQLSKIFNGTDNGWRQNPRRTHPVVFATLSASVHQPRSFDSSLLPRKVASRLPPHPFATTRRRQSLAPSREEGQEKSNGHVLSVGLVGLARGTVRSRRHGDLGQLTLTARAAPRLGGAPRIARLDQALRSPPSRFLRVIPRGDARSPDPHRRPDTDGSLIRRPAGTVRR